MKLLYEAPNPLEAHMILNLIEQAGLAGRIDGEYLQGGIGELPAAGLVRVMVEDSDYAAARDIISNWDSQQSITSNNPPPKTSRVLTAISAGFIAGALAGAALVSYLYNTPVTENGIDFNDDGILDEKWTYVDNRISKAVSDRNRDGKVDFIQQYDHKGLVKSYEADEDFNGTFETDAYYYDGKLMWIKSDTSGDGIKDLRTDFETYNTHTVTFLNSVTNKPVKVQTYNTFKLISAEIDSNGDGILDTVYTYDSIEERKDK